MVTEFSPNQKVTQTHPTLDMFEGKQVTDTEVDKAFNEQKGAGFSFSPPSPRQSELCRSLEMKIILDGHAGFHVAWRLHGPGPKVHELAGSRDKIVLVGRLASDEILAEPLIDFL